MTAPQEELTPPSTPPLATSMHATPPQPASREASLQTYNNNKNNMSSPSPREESMSSPSSRKDTPRPLLTPADCRTLQKILHDVRSPSPLSNAPYFSDRTESPLLPASNCSRTLDDAAARIRNTLSARHGVIPDDNFTPSLRSYSLTPGRYAKPICDRDPLFAFDSYSHADEREDGYQDENESMELSDAGVDEEEMGGHRSENWDDEEKPRDGDEHDAGYKDEDDSMELSDTEQEQDEEKDGDTIEDVMNLPDKTAPPAPVQDFSSFYVHDQPTPDEAKETRLKRAEIEKELEEQVRNQELERAIETSDGTCDFKVSLFDAHDKKLDPMHVHGFQALQEEIGMHAVEDEEAVAGALESLEAYDTGTSPSIQSRPHARRASGDTPLPFTSFIDFPSCAAGVVATPGGKHIDFAPTSAVPETPFTKTLSYFKQYKGKENSLSKDSPSKRRRNASSPEEIAELAREAAIEEQEAEEEKELEGLEKFRELDLAPEEPVMESTSAGDLITCGTPMRTKDGWFRASVSRSPSRGQDVSRTWTSTIRQADIYPSDSETDDWVKVQQPPATPSPQKPTLPVEQDEDHDADVEESDSSPGDEKKKLILYPRHPTFVTVIGMLPAAMFWATAAPVVNYGSRAFDLLVQRLTGLKL